MAESFEHRLLGQTLAGKYRLVSLQGAGFFSVVFVAHQLFCGRFVRPVAIKVSRQTGLTEDTAPLLFGDAMVLARLFTQPNKDGCRHLVQIHDMGLLPEHEGRAYLVMEYVEGASLLHHFRVAGKLGVAFGLRLIRETCEALALVHSMGAIHRDLIPDNILVDRRGSVRVVDFGLAAFTDKRTGFVPGAMGTFCHMAPETLVGKSSSASDVYSLGLVMYQMFTGGGPHLSAAWRTDESPARVEHNYRLKTSLKFQAPSRFHNEIRNDFGWLDSVILKCLAPDPADRFADAGELLHALQAEKEERPDPGRVPRSHHTTPGMTQRSPSRDNDLAEIREIRGAMARCDYASVIDQLDIHRPPEWTPLDAHSIQRVRLLGQAFLRNGDLAQARECLEQVRGAHLSERLLSEREYIMVLTDLHHCYAGLGLPDLARRCRVEVRSSGETSE